MKEDDGIIARFIQLRKEYGPSQAKFGKLLGLSYAAISLIELGTTKINDKHIKLISSVLGINEEWLRSGVEPMYIDGKVPGEEMMREMFRALSPEGRKIVLDYIDMVLKNERKMRGETDTEKGANGKVG
jgi:transcriptional regulator with XRE-family HTH domain